MAHTANSPAALSLIFSNRIVFYGLILVELGMVFWLSMGIQRMSVRTVPELRFHWDPTLAYADEVDQILKELAEENKDQAPPAEESS